MRRNVPSSAPRHPAGIAVIACVLGLAAFVGLDGSFRAVLAGDGGTPIPTGRLVEPKSGTSSDPASTEHGAALPFRMLKPQFDRNDEAAALEAVQIALTEVGDGSSYVWYRHGGRLSGVVQPTQSFRDTHGRICRHLLVTLSAGAESRRTATIGCRLPDGYWTLDG